MAGRRYSRILASTRYHAAVNRYIDHVRGVTTRPSRIGQGDPRPDSIRLYIAPFGAALPSAQRVVTSGAEPSWNSYKSHFTGRTVDVAPTNEANIVRLDGFKAARVNIKTNLAAQPTVKTSGVTGLQYGSYGGKSTSVPFGLKDGADTMQAAFVEIKTAIAAGLQGRHQVSLVREKVGVL